MKCFLWGDDAACYVGDCHHSLGEDGHFLVLSSVPDAAWIATLVIVFAAKEGMCWHGLKRVKNFS